MGTTTFDVCISHHINQDTKLRPLLHGSSILLRDTRYAFTALTRSVAGSPSKFGAENFSTPNDNIIMSSFRSVQVAGYHRIEVGRVLLSTTASHHGKYSIGAILSLLPRICSGPRTDHFRSKVITAEQLKLSSNGPDFQKACNVSVSLQRPCLVFPLPLTIS